VLPLSQAKQAQQHRPVTKNAFLLKPLGLNMRSSTMKLSLEQAPFRATFAQCPFSK